METEKDLEATLRVKAFTQATEVIYEQTLLARKIAFNAHAGQFRRDGVTPYIKHPEAVANSLEGEHPDVISAAWLHDVLEDTQVTAEDLRKEGIPDKVIEAVELLTMKDGQIYGEYLETLKGNEIARKVKIADIKHNLSDSPTKGQICKYGAALLVLK